MAADLPVLFFETPEQWQAWLAEHHADTPGVFLKFAKKSAGIASLSYWPALEVALCYGWIDGQSKTIDERFYLQRFTPRRPKSVWSKRNIERVTRLIDEGRMQPAGLAEIEAAKCDGRWEQAYDSPSTMQMPDDFAAVLAQNPAAQKQWETLSKSNVYAILLRIQTAKKPETRARRIQQFVQMLAEGKKLY